MTRIVSAAVEPLLQHRGWACGWLIGCAIALVSLRWIARRRWLAAAGLCVALVAAALHLFTLTAGAVALVLISGLIERGRQIDRVRQIDRGAWYFLIALAVFFVFWLAFAHWAGGIPNEAVDRGAVGAAIQPASQQLFGFPDVYDAIVRPWGRTLPILTVGLGLALAFRFRQAIRTRGDDRDAVRALLSLLVLTMLLVGISPIPRIETRYTFFLYPPLIAIAVATLLELADRIPILRRAPLAFSAAVPLLCFGATEDFQPKHIAAVDSRKSTFASA